MNRPDTTQRSTQTPLWERIYRLLPQLQCRKCGYADCAAYASALENGRASLNRCSPGGEWTIAQLAALLDWPAALADPACPPHHPGRVVIDEGECIGCARCVPACPVQAIIGMPRLLHAVLEDDCTGCELCLETCPVDCIRWVPTCADPRPWPGWTTTQAALAQRRYQARIAQEGPRPTRRPDGQRRREIQEAVERVRRRRKQV
ncbi:MAG: RnfABCDGE type electron transport complex subunit B [Acidiferrobacteraceae bacterium]